MGEGRKVEANNMGLAGNGIRIEAEAGTTTCPDLLETCRHLLCEGVSYVRDSVQMRSLRRSWKGGWSNEKGATHHAAFAQPYLVSDLGCLRILTMDGSVVQSSRPRIDGAT